MTKQEIKDLVAAKIAGQGGMMASVALPDILNIIIDAISESSESNVFLVNAEIAFNEEQGREYYYISETPAAIYAAFNAGKVVIMNAVVKPYDDQYSVISLLHTYNSAGLDFEFGDSILNFTEEDPPTPFPANQ